MIFFVEIIFVGNASERAIEISRGSWGVMTSVGRSLVNVSSNLPGVMVKFFPSLAYESTEVVVEILMKLFSGANS